ncbi:MAG: hypothetical protein AAF628_38200 [Planctomycetota bacterium]
MNTVTLPLGRRSPWLAWTRTAATMIIASAPWVPAQEDIAWAYISPAQSKQVGTITPAPSYQHSSVGRSLTVRRLETGHYLVTVPRSAHGYGVPQVSAYGGSHTMVVSGRSHDPLSAPPTVSIRVDAYDPSGARVDGGFTIYYRDGGDDEDREAYVYSICGSCPSAWGWGPYSWNGRRGFSRVVRTGVGQYRITIPGLGLRTVKGGHVQVTPHAHQLRRAQVVRWGSSGRDLVVHVQCTGAAGHPTDGEFYLSYNERALRSGPACSGASGYTWAAQPLAGGYLPYAFYSDRIGGYSTRPNAIQRTGIGAYVVNFPELIAAGSSTAQVTTYGSDGTYAVIQGWQGDGAGGTLVRVQVYDANGRPADAKFNLLYLTTGPIFC